MRSEPLRLNEIAFEVLKLNLAEGHIAPGTIIRESDLARALGVSRVPARSALQRLSENGLLIPAQGRGYAVPGTAEATKQPGGVLELVVSDQQKDVLGQRNWRQRVFQEAELKIASAAAIGSFRISELALAEHFKFSRNIARELLGRLERIGIVVQRQNGRWHLEQLREKDVHDHYVMRRLLEPVALREVASRKPADVFHKLALKLSDALLSLPEVSMSRIVQFETDLHVDIVLQTENRPLAEAIRRSQLPLLSTHLAFVGSHSPETIRETVTEHLAIITSLAAGSADEASAMLERHLAQAERTAVARLAALRSASVPPLPDFLVADP